MCLGVKVFTQPWCMASGLSLVLGKPYVVAALPDLRCCTAYADAQELMPVCTDCKPLSAASATPVHLTSPVVIVSTASV